MRAGADDAPDDSDSDSFSDSADGPSMSPGGRQHSNSSQEEREARRKRRAEAREERKKFAKMMDMQYFLEMVDRKHRYGANLRAYHSYWKEQPTSQNFFYWLDHGDGRHVEVPKCSRERLEKEQVRYLSREERLNYLVKVDHEGRLYWAKNGERVDTDDEEFRDSIHGIVHKDSDELQFQNNNEAGGMEVQRPQSRSANENDDAREDAEHYVDDFQRTKGLSKLSKVSPGVIFNHLIRAQVKHSNKWIFVAGISPDRLI